MDKAWYLKKINLFKGMTEDEMQHLSRITFMRDYAKKEVIYFPGDKGDQVYLLKKGRVKISKISEEGKEITLVVLEPGEIFGEMALLGDSKRQTIAEVVEDVHLCIISRRDFEELIARRPDLSMKITKLIGLRVRALESKIEDLAFRDVSSRLANLLLKLAEKHGKVQDNGIRINVKLTHYELGTLIGATRETTTMTLNEFKRDLLIDFHRRHIILQDKSGLRKRRGE